MKRWAMFLTVMIVGAIALESWAASAPTTEGTEQALWRLAHPGLKGQAAPAAAATAEWRERAGRELARRDYAIAWQAEGAGAGWQASNRAQGLHAGFTPQGPRLAPCDAAQKPEWSWGLELTGWGWAGEGGPLSSRNPQSSIPNSAFPIPHWDAPQLVASGDRIEYRRGALTEWYVNDPSGLEQGFTLAAPPPGDQSGGTIALSLAVRGDLRAALAPDGASLDFLSPAGASMIHYGALKTLDAAGRELPSRMELTESSDGQQTLRILVNARDAAYPLTIDPLATSAAWTAEGDQADALFGSSVASVGDINGDGYGDVIVGAPGYNQDTEGGRVMVYPGMAGGLSVTPAWTLKGDGAGSRFGASVAAAGDVNGDGYADVIVGAPGYSNGQATEGRAYLYLGSATGLAATPAWTTEGNQTKAFLGDSVASAGDVNGDGFSDVIIAASYYANGQSEEGRVWLYLGSAAGLSATPAWTAEGDQADAFFGHSIASAGDVNSDGYADVIVGAYSYDNGQDNEGRAMLYLGSAAGLAATPAWTTESDQSYAYYGSSVAAAGDVNGDGYGDVIVGASDYMTYVNGLFTKGRAYVYLGSAAGLAATPVWIADNGGYMGNSVAGAGDINGDGYGDVIVGTNGGNGVAYVYLGSATGLAATPAWIGAAKQFSGDLFGFSVAGAGDVNGDGFSDVIVGAPNFSNGQSKEGRAFVYLGAPAALAPDPGWTAEGAVLNEGLGGCVASAGDVNGDGYVDVIVGDHNYENGQVKEGRALLYLGAANGLKTASDWMVEGNQASAQLGYAVASAGDVNGDGYGDVIVGAPVYSHDQPFEGRAFLYLGSATGLSSTPAWTAEDDKSGAYFGAAVASAGDVNGDGYGDVLVGAQSYPGNATNRGRAYLYLGSASGLSATPAWTAQGAGLDSFFGNALAGAGDVNGDGFDDVIISEYGYKDGSGASLGRVLVYLGSRFGLSATPAWSVTGNNEYFGYSVASAGDVNGDGFSDIIIGAPSYGGTYLTSLGRALVYLGSATGLKTSPSWVVEGDQIHAELGCSVASAGDVNGDGFSDVIVGAESYGYTPDDYDNGVSDWLTGRAQLFLGSAAGLSPAAAWSVEGPQQNPKLGHSVASAGDVNGDGYADVLVSAPNYSTTQSGAGRVSLYYSNAEAGCGLAMLAGQYRANTLTPIAPLGLGDSTSTLRVRMLARTPFGRGKVRLEAEVKPLGTLFNGAGVTRTPWTDTGRSVAVLTANIAKIPANPTGRYHWRARLLYHPLTSPAALRAGRWITPAANGLQEADVRLIAATPPIPGTLAAELASLTFLEGTRWAVDVTRGGAPTTQTLTLSNTGETTLTFTHGAAATPGLALAGPAAASFQIDKVTPATAAPLAPGANVTVVVRFAPAVATRTLGLGASLQVTSDSPVTPLLTIPLTGDAVPVRLSGFAAE